MGCQGRAFDEKVGAVVFTDALIDESKSGISMPAALIDRLGLIRFGSRGVRTATGFVQLANHGPIRLTIQGRDGSFDVVESPEGSPVLIGSIPLHALDLVFDPTGRELVGNPLHGGERMDERY